MAAKTYAELRSDEKAAVDYLDPDIDMDPDAYLRRNDIDGDFFNIETDEMEVFYIKIGDTVVSDGCPDALIQHRLDLEDSDLVDIFYNNVKNFTLRYFKKGAEKDYR